MVPKHLPIAGLLLFAACQTPEPTARRADPVPARPVRTTAQSYLPRPTPATPAQDPDRAMRRRLSTETVSGLTFTAEDGSFGEVAQRIRVVTGIPIIITPDARTTIEGEDITFEMNLTAPVSVANLLDLMVSKSDSLGWIVRNEVVEIGTKAEAGGANKLCMYDVRDLLFPRTEFLPPIIRGIPSGEEEGDQPRTGGEADEKITMIDADTLIHTIKMATDPDYWDSEGGGTIEITESGLMLVTANAAMQSCLSRFLGGR